MPIFFETKMIKKFENAKGYFSEDGKDDYNTDALQILGQHHKQWGFWDDDFREWVRVQVAGEGRAK